MTRPFFIKVRVTADEKTSLEALALQAGLSLSDLIRKRLANVRINPVIIERERNRQLAKIGNNLNQIARWVNVYKHGIEVVRVIAALEALRRNLVDYSSLTEGDRHDN